MFAKKINPLLSVASFQGNHFTRRAFCQVHARMCFYEVLGITSRATSHEIKKAYYNKVKKFHPDHNKEASAEESFKIVAKAYETLKNPDTRQAYDVNRRNPNFSPGQDFTRASGSNYSSAASNQYKYYHSSGSTEGFDGYHGAWRTSNTKRDYEQAERNKWHQESYKSNSTTSSINSVITRVSLVVVFFVLIDLWRKRENKNTKKTSKSQPHSYENQVLHAGNSVVTTEPNQDYINREIYKKEMEQKRFKMEHHKATVLVSSEAAEAQKTYKKEKKIYDMDGFIAKKNLQIIKSEDPFGKVR